MFDLVEDMKRNDVEEFDRRQRAERDARDALRHASGQGLNASELLKLDSEDKEQAQQRIDSELAKIKQESDAAAAQAKAAEEPPPIGGGFPPPVITGG